MHILRKIFCLIAVFGPLALADGPRQLPQAEAMALVVTKVAPEYPELAKQLKLAGTVEVEATIGENGLVESVKPLNGNPVLTRTAADALRKWKFKPLVQDGSAVKFQTTWKFTFERVQR